ncbi:MAG: NAD(P)H-dependent oxidoreductase [Endomicrobiaceae bacterium]
MNAKKIAVIVGSLRKESFNRKTANILIKTAPDSLNLEILEIKDLSLYNEDIENNPPASWVTFRNKLKTFDGVIFVTPEYNRSTPAVIKNAIDIASRPYGQSAWDGKPGAVISVSQGNIGGFGANHHLRQSLVFLNVPVMQQPEAYIGNVAGLFDDEGNLTNDSTKIFLKKFLDTFSQWVYKNS